MTRRSACALSLAASAALTAPGYAAQRPAAQAPVVVAVVAERSVDVLHREYQTPDGRDITLPDAIARSVVRITIPRTGDRDTAVDALNASPVGHPKVGTLYYIRGTRLLVYYGTGAPGPVLADAFHGTRRAVHDEGSGVRHGSLAVPSSSARPKRGPLADGSLTADELLATVLASAKPFGSDRPGRYATEGYGWLDKAAELRALDVLTGVHSLPARAEDDAEHAAALAARNAIYTSRGCNL